MVKIIKYLVIIAVIIGGALWYFQYFSKPENTVARFEDSVNHDNVMQMVDLIDPEKTKELRKILKLANTFSDPSSDMDIADDVLPLLPILSDYADTDADGTMPEVTFSDMDTTNINLLRTKATVTVNTTFQYENETKEAKGTFHLEKTHRKWYITNIENSM